MLANGTLQSHFWNGWSDFIAAGNMKFVGYLLAILTLTIIVTMVFKGRKQYDEYQASILEKLMIVAGGVSMVMLPLMLFMFLSDRNYLVENLFLFVTVQWLSVLIGNLIYAIKY